MPPLPLRRLAIALLAASLRGAPALAHPGHEEAKPAPPPAPAPEAAPTARPGRPLRTGVSPSAERAAKIGEWFRSSEPGGLEELRDAAAWAYEGAAELEPPPVPASIGADRRALSSAQPRKGFAARSVPNLFAAESEGKPAAKGAGAKAEGKAKAEDGGSLHKGAVIGAAMGMLVLGAIGFALGGPFGAMAGIVIGALAGALAGRLLSKK